MNAPLAQIMRHLFGLGAVAAFILSGCVSQQPAYYPPEQTSSPSPDPVYAELIQPALNTIDKRIALHERRLDEWKEALEKPSALMVPRPKLDKSTQCTSQLLDILTGYDTLKNRLRQESSSEQAQRLINGGLLQLNEQDLAYTEGECPALLHEIKSMPATPPSAPLTPPPAVSPPPIAPPDAQIRALYAQGEYDRVITLYHQQNLAPGQLSAYETTHQYGLALMKNQQYEEAGQIFADLLNHMRGQGQQPLELQVLRNLADLDMSANAYSQAKSRYEEIARLSAQRGVKENWTGTQLAFLQQDNSPSAEEATEYNSLLRNYLGYTPKRDGYSIAEQAERFLSAYPASRLVANVNAIHKETREQADAWVKRGVDRVEQQVGAGSQAPSSTPATPAPPSPSQEKKSPPTTVGDAPAPPAAQTQSLSPEQVAAREVALQQQYDQAMAHLSKKEYDKAMGLFSPLIGTSLGDKAQQRMNESARFAAEDNRQKAAELFARANSASSPETKKNLLLSSQRLLQEILHKYPQAGLNERVERHLKRVEEVLRGL